MRCVIAIKAFFAVLFDKAVAAEVGRLLSGEPAAEPVADKPAATPLPGRPAPLRDPAITLLAALQREARLIDLIKEDLGRYSDAQVGAAARPCLQQCAGVLDRFFQLQPLLTAAEGEQVQVGDQASPMRYQWIGEGTAATGKLVHHGWQASRVELPQWSGDRADANVIAPAQLQAG
jgi:hypothetical protein